jgi:hypothetical protein
VGKSRDSTKNQDVQIPTMDKKLQTIAQSMEQGCLWQHLPRAEISRGETRGNTTRDNSNRLHGGPTTRGGEPKK